MNKLSISILGTRGIPARYGGFETFAEHLAIGMADLGHEVVVYCPQYQDYKSDSLKGVRLFFVMNLEHRFKHRVPRAICNLLYDVCCLIKACKKDQPKHVYMLGYSAGPFLALPRLFGKLVTVNPDGLEWKSSRWGPLARTWLYLCELVSARFCNQLIGDAEPISERFRTRYKAEIETIEYGTELPSLPLEPAGYEPLSYYIAIARMVPETKLDVIIDGFKKAKLENRILLVVGPITDQQFFDIAIASRVDNATVFYLGAIYDKGRLHSLRANAAALIHGHASDGTNPSLLESMACGSAVIAIDRDSNRKVLLDNSGFFFQDEHDLCEQLTVFEKVPLSDRRQLGLSNRTRVASAFSWPRAVSAHVRVFDDLERKHLRSNR